MRVLYRHLILKMVAQLDILQHNRLAGGERETHVYLCETWLTEESFVTTIWKQLPGKQLIEEVTSQSLLADSIVRVL